MKGYGLSLAFLFVWMQPITLHAKSQLISWNINAYKKECLNPSSIANEKIKTFIALPNEKASDTYLMITDQKAFLVDSHHQLTELHWKSCLDLQLIENENKILALTSDGTHIYLASCDNLDQPKKMGIPHNHCLKSCTLYHRVLDEKLFLFGLSASCEVIYQYEISQDRNTLTHVRTINASRDLDESLEGLLCDNEFSLLYVLGNEGKLVCYDADPKALTQPLRTLQEGKIKETNWLLFKLEKDAQNGSIGLLEKNSMVACVWKRAQSELKPKRFLALLCPKSLAMKQLNGPFTNEIASLDHEGNLHFILADDFIIE